MLRFVLDTNVILSAALSVSGRAAMILQLADAGHVRLYFSSAILKEYIDVLSRHEMGLDKHFRAAFLKRLRSIGHMVRPSVQILASPDPKDNIFLECAETAKAHYLVTENIKDFPKTWKYTKVVRSSDFLRRWQTQKPAGLR